MHPLLRRFHLLQYECRRANVDCCHLAQALKYVEDQMVVEMLSTNH